ncbi:MAG: site-specific integrase [Paracoccaceae bacterium]
MDMEESALIVPVSKTGKRRVIYLSERSKNVIVAIRDKSEALGLPATHNSYLVKNPRTGKPYNNFQLSFSRARAAVGINDVRIHDLPNTYASLLIQNGVSLYEVQKLLGHSGPNMTQRYAHLNPNSLKQIVNNLPSFL